MGTQPDVGLPKAIADRFVPVSVSGGRTVMVEKWAITKLIQVMSWLTTNVKDASTFFKDDAEKMDTFDFIQKILAGLDDKLPEFLRLALSPADAAVVLEIPSDEAFEVVVEILKHNLTDKLRKKVAELFELFRSTFPVRNKST